MMNACNMMNFSHFFKLYLLLLPLLYQDKESCKRAREKTIWLQIGIKKEESISCENNIWIISDVHFSFCNAECIKFLLSIRRANRICFHQKTILQQEKENVDYLIRNLWEVVILNFLFEIENGTHTHKKKKNKFKYLLYNLFLKINDRSSKKNFTRSCKDTMFMLWSNQKKFDS